MQKCWRIGWVIFFGVMCCLPQHVCARQADEWIEAYFNMPADHTVAYPGNQSQSSYDLMQTLVQLIDSARHSIDASLYDIEHPAVARALVRAKQRGLRVRLVTDNHNRNDAGIHDERIWEMLRKAGIYSIDDDGDVYHPDGSITDFDLVNDGADMHHKFVVFDFLSPDSKDDYVWTGSTNITYTGAYNTNHALLIKDSEVAGVYTREFEQMWGGSGETPNPLDARFHKDKLAGGPHVFDVGGTRVEIYFAPVNRDRSKPSVSERLVQLLNDEVQHDIHFQAFAITPTIPISEQIWTLSEDTTIYLHGLIDRRFYSRYASAGDIWTSEAARRSNRHILPAKELRTLHHKVLLLDALHPDSNDIAVTVAGSYNFSMNAEMNNDENTVIIYSDKITNQFYQDFMGAVSRAKEKSFPPAPPIDPSRWYEVFSISDGSRFEIEVVPGFGYPVRLLGVEVPSLYAGGDSAWYYSGAAADYLQNILTGRKVRIKGVGGKKPQAHYNALRAYVDLQYDSQIVGLNKLLLEKGFGTTSPYYRQHEDSVEAFSQYEEEAKTEKRGLWKNPSRIGTKVLRAKEADTGNPMNVLYPININTADEAMLQLLPGIGPAYSKRIVEYREAKGLFGDVSEITRIKGIGPKTLEKLRPITTVD